MHLRRCSEDPRRSRGCCIVWESFIVPRRRLCVASRSSLVPSLNSGTRRRCAPACPRRRRRSRYGRDESRRRDRQEQTKETGNCAARWAAVHPRTRTAGTKFRSGPDVTAVPYSTIGACPPGVRTAVARPARSRPEFANVPREPKYREARTKSERRSAERAEARNVAR